MFGLYTLRINKIGDAFVVFKADKMFAKTDSIKNASFISDKIRDGKTKDEIEKMFNAESVGGVEFFE